MLALSSLPPEARLRLSAIAPALSDEFSAVLLSALNKLMTQFAREGRITDFAGEILGEGHILGLGWLDAQGPLSGCSHDKIGQLLQSFEQRSACHLLDAPPIVVEATTGLCCVDRTTLKAMVANGTVSLDSKHWDLRSETIAAWNTTGRQPARDTWLGPVIQRALQAS
jgi:hypothetical protein